MPDYNIKPMAGQPPPDMYRTSTAPYYAELKRHGIRLPCFLTHIRTDAARIEKPTDARTFRMLFLTPRTDGCCGTIDTSSQTNLIMQWQPPTKKTSTTAESDSP